jgi:hypothetical protein
VPFLIRRCSLYCLRETPLILAIREDYGATEGIEIIGIIIWIPNGGAVKMAYQDEETDIIVVGSGLAGLAAAVEAAQAGASVIVLEKMKVIGGNTRISDGSLAAPCNYLQKRLGIKDSLGACRSTPSAPSCRKARN